jgi:hypothetical protein
MHNTWEAYRGDSTKSSDLLFTAKKSSIIQPLKTEMYIYLASNTSHEICDFKMMASFKERACSFYLGNTNILIAQVIEYKNFGLCASDHALKICWKFVHSQAVCHICCFCRCTVTITSQATCWERITIVLPCSQMSTTCSSRLLL